MVPASPLFGGSTVYIFYATAQNVHYLPLNSYLHNLDLEIKRLQPTPTGLNQPLSYKGQPVHNKVDFH